MRSCPGPGDIGLWELADREAAGPSQRELDAMADAEYEREVDEARDAWDRERGLMIDEDEN